MSAPDFTEGSLDASAIPAVDITYGIQGTKLDTPLADLPGLTFSEDRAGYSFYTRATDSMQVGLATVDYIEYGFIEDKLAVIYIGFSNKVDGENLRNVFSRVYGRGFGIGGLIMWSGEKAYILYTEKEDNSGYLAFSINTPTATDAQHNETDSF